MATKNPRVWFKSISLENVRSFGTKQTIYFTEDGTENGTPARWNVILGDNGTGKTTVLRSIYVTTKTDSEVIKILDDELYFMRRKDVAPSIESLVNFRDAQMSRIVKLTQVFELSAFHSKLTGEKEYSVFNFLEIDGHPQIDTKENINITIYGYGASRRSGVDSRISFENGSSDVSLFNDDAALVDVEGWLLRADHAGYKNEKLRDRYELIRQTILSLFREELIDIYVGTEMSLPKVFAKTHYGEVRLSELSLGYKTLIAWMVDFAKGLLDSYPDSTNPLAEPAVCLVDEIDLHLHPKFQRTIIKFLTETFPSTQFIVTAHSPLIVVAAEERPIDANIILLKREGDQTVVVNEPVDVSKWSVDQILNSDLFGHVAARSEPLTKLRSERDKLLGKPKRTKKEDIRLGELDEKIGFVPFGKDQAEIQAETIIQQLADVLRKQQAVQ